MVSKTRGACRRRGIYAAATTGAAMAALVLGGCGSSSGTKSASTTTPTSVTSPTTASSSSASPTTAASGSLASFQAALDIGYKGTSQEPPSTSPPPKKGVTLWIISCGQSAPGCAGPVSGAAAAGKALGWTVHIVDGKFGAGGAYTTGIEQAVAAKASVIIPVGIDCNVAKTAYEEAVSAKIPIVALNSFDCNNPLVHDGAPIFSSQLESIPSALQSEQFNEQLGKLQADWLIVHDKGKAKIIEFTIEAVTGLTYEEVGFNSVIAKCSGCTVVDKIGIQPPDEADGVAAQVFSSTLTKNPTANAVWTADDSLIDSAQVPQAIAAAGRLSGMVVLGVQGYAQNLTLIRESKGQNLAVSYSGPWEGWGIVDEANRFLNGQKPALEGVGLQVIDATHNLPPAGQDWTPSINYVAAYEKAWG